MFVITNITKARIAIDHVVIEPSEQLRVLYLTADMMAARNGGQLRVLLDDESPAERKQDADAFKPFKTGDPRIDG